MIIINNPQPLRSCYEYETTLHHLLLHYSFFLFTPVPASLFTLGHLFSAAQCGWHLLALAAENRYWEVFLLLHHIGGAEVSVFAFCNSVVRRAVRWWTRSDFDAANRGRSGAGPEIAAPTQTALFANKEAKFGSWAQGSAACPQLHLHRIHSTTLRCWQRFVMIYTGNVSFFFFFF